MYTRCIACHTVHPVNAALLARGAGKYRCGKCNTLNNALESLFDSWPDAGTAPPQAGSVPTFGLNLDLEGARQDAVFADQEPADLSATSGKRGIPRTAWIAVTVLLVLATAFNFAHFFRQPLMDNPQLQRGLVKVGLQEEPPEAGMPDLDLIELVSSEMRSHPGQLGALQLSATITNRARVKQAYPELEVVLLDSLGQPLASRVFEPSDYLAQGAEASRGMAPGAYLPLVLNLADPGQQAVGFELKIR
jgi:predicted Zn finger-like uncharacterized protein